MKYCERCGAAFRAMRTCPRDGIPLRANTADPMIGRVLGDRYRVLERIGAGGMGQVYRVAHTRIACGFALKIVWGDVAYERDTQARFTREAEVGSCLSSRFIVRVVDFGFAETATTAPPPEGLEHGLPYIVMELVNGPTLYDELLRVGPMEPARAIRIAHRVALGLAHAHERGVVHRDLKPENILLVREDDEDDVPKLLDFGVAKGGGERLTVAGIAVGTPLYMAPEQIRGGEVDARTDLYAFGVVLHEMLTGTPPFDAPTLEELLRKHLAEVPPSLRPKLAPLGHGALADIVQRLLHKRPEDRYGSARELVSALTEASVATTPPRSRAPIPTPPVARTAGVVDVSIQEQIERAIVSGAPRYNANDHAGCAALYASVARAIADAPSTAMPVAARLNAALYRAQLRTSATDAAWDLRFAFDDLLAPALFDGSRLEGFAWDLAAFAAIAARREAQGQVEILGDYHLAFARILAARARAASAEGGPASGDVGWVRRLEEAVREADQLGGGAAAKNVVEPVVWGIGPGRSPARTIIPQLSTSIRTEIAQAGVPPEATDRILRAIRAGAPAFNEGRPDVCARVYREAACEIVTFCGADPSNAAIAAHVRRAIDEADRRTHPSDAAWVLRYAFDGVLATVPASA